MLPTVLSVGASGPREDRGHILLGLARCPLQMLLSNLVARWMSDRFGSSFGTARPHPAYDLAREACLDKLSSGLTARDLFVAAIATGADPEQARLTDPISKLARKHGPLHWIARGSASACVNPANGCALATFEAVPGAIALMLPRARAGNQSPSSVSLAASYAFGRSRCAPARIVELFAPSATFSRRGSPAHV